MRHIPSSRLIAAGRPRRLEYRGSRTAAIPDAPRRPQTVLGTPDTGVYVSVSGFTADAGDAARAQDTRRVMLVDGPEQVRLWTENASKIAETDRELLPLRPIFLLDGNE
jgi:hypothetical protein